MIVWIPVCNMPTPTTPPNNCSQNTSPIKLFLYGLFAVQFYSQRPYPKMAHINGHHNPNPSTNKRMPSKYRNTAQLDGVTNLSSLLLSSPLLSILSLPLLLKNARFKVLTAADVNSRPSGI
jgi:hypothetical protein